MKTQTKTAPQYVSAKNLQAGDFFMHGFDSIVTRVATIGFGSQVIVSLASGEQLPGFSPLSRVLVQREVA
jgi:hypothetical protein